MSHSDIVGGSTAKRVMNCPGSVKLCQQMPPKPTSKYAEEGTRLHDAMHQILSNGASVDDYDNGDKLRVALDALNDIDLNNQMEFQTEVTVSFGGYLAGVFGSCDLLGRIGNRAVVLDWKFGDGVSVDAEENHQLLFYAAGAMRTEEVRWAFEGVTEIECVIVQPPYVKRWVTTPGRVKAFERDLFDAVTVALKPNAPVELGDHCKWCAAKPICPAMTGETERALRTKLNSITPEGYSNALVIADRVEEWAKEVREMAQQALENGIAIPGFKLVPKRATRQWVNDEGALEALKQMGLELDELTETKLRSPAQMEKVLKKHKLELPKDHVVAVSTGNTLAPESDPRPAVLQIGKQIREAFSKLG
jgi:hypothetical protein